MTADATPSPELAEARRRLAELEDTEGRYRKLVEQLPLAVYRDLPDESATSEYISPQVEAIFGYARDAWMDPAFFAAVLHPDDREHTIGATAAALARGDDRWSMEYRVIAADGRTVWVRDDAWMVKDGDGRVTHVQGVMIDVTDQAVAHAEIRRQKQYFESLVDISPVAVVVMDADERVTGWNPAATRLFGYSAEEAIGRLIDDLVLDEEFRGEGRDVTREALDAGRTDRVTRRARKDGALVDVQMMLVPLRVDGEHVGNYAIYHDITELQRAREHAETLLAVTRVLGKALSLEDTIEVILDELQRVVPYDSCSVQVIHDNRLVIVGGRGLGNLDALLGQGFDLDDETSLNNLVVRSKRTQVFADVSQNPIFASELHGGGRIRGWICAPMIVGRPRSRCPQRRQVRARFLRR